jgi:maltooligosyltrehalose trehalohydrolase
MGLGALVDGRGTHFRVWAPLPKRVELLIGERRIPLEPSGDGYWDARVDGVGAGTRYAYLLDGERRRPDPASRSQPEGVHADSEVIDPRAFAWQHDRPRRPLAEWVIYELHVGTFTREGSFDAAARELDRLVDLGVNAVELMPVNTFPGRRNWGYDGVGWYAPQASYGGPEGLRRLVDAAHARSLAVIADVVYNHLGPEGNYLGELGRYFTTRFSTPWGSAIDFAEPAVRAHVIENARMFAEEYRVDALRLDAVHAIFDDSPRHIVAELCDEIDLVIIAESDLGDVKVISEPSDGWGCHAQWSDDLHHALHAALTAERHGYYADFGSVEAVARAVRDGFVHTGEFSPYRKRAFGTPSQHLPGERFVVCSQNHDQVGNRGLGERLHQLVPGGAHAAAATVLLAPAVPLLFMGEEHADPAPFLYFTDHGDPELVRAVREGRKREFAMAGDVPDPQDPQTFERSRVDPARGRPALRRFYQQLLRLRRERPALRALDKSRTDARAHGSILTIRRFSDEDDVLAAISLGAGGKVGLPAPRRGRWLPLLDAGDFEGPTGVRVERRDRALEITLPPLGVIVFSTDEKEVS